MNQPLRSLLGLLAATPCLAATTPNVVIIYADDIGFGDLSCYGHGKVPTPNVDKLAQSGMRFTNAHCAASTSTPSRYSMLTGEYAWRREGTGIAQGDAALIIPTEKFTIADMFKAAGYRTAVVGKWHLGLGAEQGKQDWNKRIKPNPADIGFDYSFIMAATGDRTPCIYIENGLGVGLDPADPIFVSYTKNFPNEPTGKDNPELLTLHPSVGHNQAIVHGVPRIGFMTGGKKARWHDGDIADVLSEKACAFIEAQKGNAQPFFLYLGTNDIHVPRVPHKRFVGKSGLGARGDALLSYDWTVGQVVKKLEELGMADNTITIIIISSDNGPVLDDGYKDQAVELLGDHKPSGDFRGGKYSNFEGGTRVPCILNWAGKVPAGTSNALMSQIDWFASFASMLNVKIPAGAAMDSQDHLSTWLGKDQAGRDELVKNGFAISVGDWKYIAPSRGLGELLFNIAKDPSETKNLAPEEPEKLQEMRAAFKAANAS
ncbi:MAG: sulfatase-like hydrolase/transferase [Akkermansia sp.]